MEEMPISEFKARCLRLLGQIKKTGQSLIITKNGVPVALVSPPPPVKSEENAFGVLREQTQVNADLTEPLGEGSWKVFSEK